MTGSMLTDITYTGLVEISHVGINRYKQPDIPEPTYKRYVGSPSRFLVCAERNKLSQVYPAWIGRIRRRHLISV